ncbi:MAG TPA: 1,4-dihydroxy-2-naphthoate polyprenyltransferase [Acidimicrobiales bacterium]|nr:1,4-dihydroxy-2-naphthoate polyprenyltransferase [Acidimicrobiales bacterium]
MAEEEKKVRGNLSLWIQGARPRTLGAALAPVLVGTAVASRYGPVIWWRALVALVVALALQVGVNYANDYSDGVRGVDRQRKGPVRLTASGLVPARSVRRAALLAFGVGAVAGLVLALAVDLRLILVGVAAIGGAALYSGGPRPYASAGLGEVSVLVFFGLVATCGSAYVQLERVPWLAVGGAVAVGLLACAILLVNNLRDVESDAASGKRTLAVRIGPAATRSLYTATVAGGLAAPLALAPVAPGALLALAAAPLAAGPVRTVATRRDPRSLVAALVGTARLQLVLSVLLAVGLWL